MNPERPEDPREQMEVRITALLLGEASAFEEAELHEAIENDEELKAYYEAMRGTVNLVEEAIPSEPTKADGADDPPNTLDDRRRAQLQKLFRKPRRDTIMLDAIKRAKSRAFMRNVTSIAAALTMLGAAIWIFISSIVKERPLRVLTSGSSENPLAFQSKQMPNWGANRMWEQADTSTAEAVPVERFYVDRSGRSFAQLSRESEPTAFEALAQNRPPAPRPKIANIMLPESKSEDVAATSTRFGRTDPTIQVLSSAPRQDGMEPASAIMTAPLAQLVGRETFLLQ